MATRLVSSDKVGCFFLRIVFLLDVYNKSGCGVVTLGQFDKFKMATNVTENQQI